MTRNNFHAVILLCLILSGCLAAPETIRDVRQLRQDHAFYIHDPAEGPGPLSEEAQKRLDEDYNIIHFSVWHQSGPFHARPRRVRNDFASFAAKPGYGENKRLHPPSWFRKISDNAALSRFPNAQGRAITLRNTSLRVLPTVSPHFYSRNGDASAWPFDNLQRSAVAVNTPLFVCHVSADKSWTLVETSFTFGWMPSADLALVDDAFVSAWESGRYAVITRDFTSVLDEDNRFLVRASIGAVFPLAGQAQDRIEIQVAVTDARQQAVIRKGFVLMDAAAPKPLRFTPVNAARIANEMLGEPYGWGGLYERRDCSAMTRDFFSVFGIWLPRHSADQIQEAGAYINLSGLSPSQKEKVILEKGIPYLTLLWRKGHVMLYIGEENGQALIFHNIWGVRTKDLFGREGRKVIGQAVITTLQPGKELRNIDAAAGSLLSNLSGMKILAPPAEELSSK